MKRNGDSIDTIKLTISRAIQQNISGSTSLLCQSITGIVKFKGNLWPGPPFCWPDLSLISRNFFIQALSNSIRFCDLDVSGYKSHSFRIVAASWAASNGMSDAQIRRWKSNAFLRYIRAPSIGST